MTSIKGPKIQLFKLFHQICFHGCCGECTVTLETRHKRLLSEMFILPKETDKKKSALCGTDGKQMPPMLNLN